MFVFIREYSHPQGVSGVSLLVLEGIPLELSFGNTAPSFDVLDEPVDLVLAMFHLIARLIVSDEAGERPSLITHD